MLIALSERVVVDAVVECAFLGIAVPFASQEDFTLERGFRSFLVHEGLMSASLHE